MKNFFKKLAFVLALAMVLVSVAPATANAAAKAPSLKKTSKILYIGGDITGTIPDTYRFYFNNAKGYTATWESLNEDVVAIEGKNVVAVGVGKAVVKATLTNKAGNEVVREATVWVKQNAEKVGFGTIKKDALRVGETQKVNVFRQVGDKKVWTQNDMKTVTDKIVWTTSDEKIATVDKWGTVKAVAPGEVTITATATQPQGPTAGESAEYKLTVLPATESVQTAYNAFELTFGSEEEAKLAVDKTKPSLNTANAAVSENKEIVKVFERLNNTEKSKVAKFIKSIEQKASDKKVVVVTMFDDFTPDTTFTVEYLDFSESFVAAKYLPQALSMSGAYKSNNADGGTTELSFDLYSIGSKGQKVNITDKIYDAKSYVTIEDKAKTNDYTKYYLDVTNKAINFYTEDKSVAVGVNATFTYWTTDNKEIVLKTEGTFGPRETATVGVLSQWGIAVAGSTGTTNPKDKMDWSRKAFAVDDKNYQLVVELKINDTETVYSTNQDITFKSSNDDKLAVNELTGEIYPPKQPLNETVAIYVFYKDKFAGTCPVQIYAKRELTSFEVKALDNSKLAHNANLTNDSVSFELVAKDQLGDIIDNVFYDVKQITKTDNIGQFKYSDSMIADKADTLTVTADSISATTPKLVQATVTVEYPETEKKITRSLSFYAKATDANDTKTYNLVQTSASTTDLKVSGKTLAEKFVEYEVYGIDKDGFKTGKILVQDTEKTATGVSAEVIFNGKVLTDNVEVTTGGSIKINTVVAAGGSIGKISANDTVEVASGSAFKAAYFSDANTDKLVQKLKLGTYRVNVYENGVSKGGANFTLKDTDDAVTFTWSKYSTVQSDTIAAVNDCITVKVGDTAAKVVGVVHVTSGYRVTVKQIVVDLGLVDGIPYYKTIDVLRTINTNAQ